MSQKTLGRGTKQPNHATIPPLLRLDRCADGTAVRPQVEVVRHLDFPFFAARRICMQLTQNALPHVGCSVSAQSAYQTGRRQFLAHPMRYQQICTYRQIAKDAARPRKPLQAPQTCAAFRRLSSLRYLPFEVRQWAVNMSAGDTLLWGGGR